MGCNPQMKGVHSWGLGFRSSYNSLYEELEGCDWQRDALDANNGFAF